MSQEPKSIGTNSKREVLVGAFIHTTGRDRFVIVFKEAGTVCGSCLPGNLKENQKKIRTIRSTGFVYLSKASRKERGKGHKSHPRQSFFRL